MEQKAYLSEVQALPLEQREKLINTLLKLGNRRGVRGQRLTWEELFSLRPELKVYNIPTLRHYLELCDSFWLLQSVETDEEGFFQKGVTEWGGESKEGWWTAPFKSICFRIGNSWIPSFFPRTNFDSGAHLHCDSGRSWISTLCPKIACGSPFL